MFWFTLITIFTSSPWNIKQERKQQPKSGKTQRKWQRRSFSFGPRQWREPFSFADSFHKDSESIQIIVETPIFSAFGCVYLHFKNWWVLNIQNFRTFRQHYSLFVCTIKPSTNTYWIGTIRARVCLRLN